MYTSSAIIINDKREILLIKRGEYTNKFPRYWSIPGGRGEEGEKPENTVVREVKEEVNLDFYDIIHYQTSELDRGPAHRFLGKYSGEIKLQVVETLGYGWFTYEETKKLDLAFDYKNIFKKLYLDGHLH